MSSSELVALYERFDYDRIALGPHDVVPSDHGAENFVRTAAIGDGWLHPRSSNYTFVVELTDGACHGFGVYKPERGEAPLWDFGAGLYRRECAAYELAKLLGWSFIPPTVVRTAEAGAGSLQLYVPFGDESNFFTMRESHSDELCRMAVFDMIANNADRKGGHCFIGPSGELLGVDHGLTFHSQHKLRTVIWDFAGSQVPEALLADLEALQMLLRSDNRSDAAELAGLAAFINASELDALRVRVESILANHMMPHPYSRRDIPFPPM